MFSMPAYCKRRFNAVLLVLGLSGAKWIAIAFFDPPLQPPAGTLFELASRIFDAAAMGSILIGAWWFCGIRERVAGTGGYTCPKCAYDLRGSAIDRGTCPECGDSYTRESLRLAWREFLRFPPYVVRLFRALVVGGAIVVTNEAMQGVVQSIPGPAQSGTPIDWRVMGWAVRLLALCLLVGVGVWWSWLRRPLGAPFLVTGMWCFQRTGTWLAGKGPAAHGVTTQGLW